MEVETETHGAVSSDALAGLRIAEIGSLGDRPNRIHSAEGKPRPEDIRPGSRPYLRRYGNI